MGWSNKLLEIFNAVAFVLSLPIIGTGIWLAVEKSSICNRFLQWPVIILGLGLLVFSVLGFVGSRKAISFLLWIYLVVTFLLILGLLAFIIFTFVVTDKGDGQAVSGKGFQEYRLGEYSTWLQKLVGDNSTWSKIQSCLGDAAACGDLDAKYPTVQRFNAANLSPLESGCCKPPTSCGFTFDNATRWDIGRYRGTDSDCKAWSNNPKGLCFKCDSCKAGSLQNIKEVWRTVAIVLSSTDAVLFIVFSVCCIAVRNKRKSGPKKTKSGPNTSGHNKSGHNIIIYNQ